VATFPADITGSSRIESRFSLISKTAIALQHAVLWLYVLIILILGSQIFCVPPRWLRRSQFLKVNHTIFPLFIIAVPKGSEVADQLTHPVLSRVRMPSAFNTSSNRSKPKNHQKPTMKPSRRSLARRHVYGRIFCDILQQTYWSQDGSTISSCIDPQTFSWDLAALHNSSQLP